MGRKTGPQLRKILQVIPLNAIMVDPLSLLPLEEYGLLGPGALAQLVAEADILEARALDQGNAFTAIEVPWWWWRLMAGPVVLAAELPESWV